jgi:hypothetical protein
MAISTTLAVNMSVSLTYGSLGLTSATKTSSATCGSTGGASYQDLPTLSTTPRVYTALGPISMITPYLVYVENYDTGSDYFLAQYSGTMTINAGGFSWSAAVTYVANDIVRDTSEQPGGYYICIVGVMSPTHPHDDATHWTRIGGLEIPFGRAITAWLTGSFSLVATLAPATSGECKLVAIQDA